MVSVSKFSRTYIASLLTSLGLIAAVLYYIFLYIPRNEERVNARYYRVLLRVGENAQLRIKNYQAHVAPNYINSHSALEELDNNEVRRNALLPTKTNQAPFWILNNCPDTDRTHTVEYGRLIHLPVTTRSQGSKSQNYHIIVPSDTLLLPLMRWDTFNHFFILKGSPPKKNIKQISQVVFSASKNREGGAVNLVPTDTLTQLAYYAAWKIPQDVTITGIAHKIFVLNLKVAPDEEWLICGAVPTSRYDTERKAIPSYILTTAFLTIAILLLLFPFLKFALMNKEERLHQSDIVFAIVSLFIGIAFAVVLLLNFYAFYGADKNIELKRLTALNNALKESFVQELDILVKQLYWYDSIAAVDTSPYLTNVRHFHKDSITTPLKDNSSILSWDTPLKQISFVSTKVSNSTASATLSKQPPNALHHLKRVFWIDTNGTPKKVWTTKLQPDRMSPLHDRNYFKSMMNGSGWSLPGNPTKFYLESVSSYVDGQSHAVLSIKSERRTPTVEVAAMTTKLATLSNPILPPNYRFCIVNQDGEVLFHQSENLNLNENLREETGYNPLLTASLFTELPVDFVGYYQGTNRLMYVSPIQGLPLFMITYVNYDALRESNADTILLTIVFLLLYASILVILITLVIYGRRRKPKISFGWLAFRWMWPNPQKSTIYKKNAWALVLSLVVLAYFIYNTPPLVSFFLTLIASIYAYILCYVSLHPVPYKQLLKRRNNSYVRFIQRFLLSSTLVVVLVNLLLCLIAGKQALFIGLVFQLILITIIAIVHSTYKSVYINFFQSRIWIKEGADNIPPTNTNTKNTYLYRYVLLIMVWLLLASAMPAFVMYRNAYNFMAEIKVVLAQLYVAKRLSGTNPDEIHTITKDQSGYSPQAHTYNYASFYQGTHQDSIYKNSSTNNLVAGEPILSKVANLTGLGFIYLQNQGNAQSSNCIQGNCEINRWVFSGDRGLSLHSTYKDAKGKSIILSSNLPLYKLPWIFNLGNREGQNTNSNSLNISGIFFWVDVAIFILVIFFFLVFLVTRIFNLDVQTNLRMRELEERLLRPDDQNKLLVLSLPGAPKVRDIVSSLGLKYNIPLEIEEIDLSQSIKEQTPDFQRMLNGYHKVFILKHFEYQPLDISALKTKITYLERFEQLKQAKIILLSAMHPSYWEERIKKQEAQPNEGTILMHHMLNLLSNYTKLYNPLRGDTLPLIHDTPYLLDKKDFLSYFIEKECGSLPMLKQFRKHMVNFIKDRISQGRDVEKDDLILRMQSLAQLYYRQLWISCSEEEQFFLYDLAQDGLVNGKNIKVLTSLLGKGLIVRDDRKRLLLVNESFRYFVLNVVEPSEALRYEHKVAKGSGWHQYKVPLLLAIFGIALFIFFTQQKTWLHIVAVTTTISTVLSLLPRLSILLPAFLLGKDQNKA